MMLYQPYLADNQPRRGVVLLVVIVMLALFAAVGITFVFYSEASSAASDSWKQSQVLPIPDMDPEMAFQLFLQQLIFDVPDDGAGLYSALRGHSLLRNMYGLNYDYGGTNGTTVQLNNNTVPFTGTGRQHYQVNLGKDPVTNQQITEDNYKFINYTYFPGLKLRDPERFDVRNDAASPRGLYTEPFSASYTYPDLNSLFLGAIDKDANLLMPSYYRPWLFDPQHLGYPANPNWTNGIGKYLTLRPRPLEHPNFPPPEDGFALDVRNLPPTNLPGGNALDSHWIPINAPVFRLPDGRKYTMLVAPLIIDLDGKVNLNVHGNIKQQTTNAGTTTTRNASNHGWGPWEVSLSQILNFDTKEWQNVYLGVTAGNNPNNFQRVGRYGPDGHPEAPAITTPQGRSDHYYAQTDTDGARDNGDNQPGTILLPGSNVLAPANSLFPFFSARWGNGNPNVERKFHPSLYNAFKPAYINSTTYDRGFRVSNIEKLYRSGSTGDEAMTSELLQLLPNNLANDLTGTNGLTSAQRRRLLTLLSANLKQPGVTPWAWSPPGGSTYGTTNPLQFPSGTNQIFPKPGQAVSAFDPQGTSDFGADWRYNNNAIPIGAQALTRINLRRPLKPYPIYPNNGQGDQTQSSYQTRFDQGTVAGGTFTLNSIAIQFQQAQADRQKLADDIYRRLLLVTAIPPVPAARQAQPLDSDLAPRRWLAQLAVNIVDYIDEDDIITPFNFYSPAADGLAPTQLGAMLDTASGAHQPEVPRYWVFGTEMPRLILNEVLIEKKPGTANVFQNSVWVELLNPLSPPTPQNQHVWQPQDGFPVQLCANPNASQLQSGTWQNPSFPNGFAPYKIVVTDTLWGINNNQNNNVVGKPNYYPPVGGKNTMVETLDSDFDTTATSKAVLIPTNTPQTPLGNAYQQGTTPSAYVPPAGYFLVGPPAPDKNQTIGGTSNKVPNGTPIMKVGNNIVSNMVYFNTVTAGVPSPIDDRRGVTVLLRRLANPHLPWNNNPRDPNGFYNPYITIDYLERVPSNSTALTRYSSRSKRQPFAGLTIPLNPPTTQPNSPVMDTNPAGPTGTFHTFGQQNVPGPQSGNYTWLVHFDRAPISPMELLHVSAFQPHQLTQKFIGGSGTDQLSTNLFLHYAPWFDQLSQVDPTIRIFPGNSARLYRLFEFLECTLPQGWVASNGGSRLLGQININTMYDKETFRALCDPWTNGNDNPMPFTTTDVDTMFIRLKQSRSPNLASSQQLGPVGFAPGTFGSLVTDRPFLSLATGPSQNGAMITPPGGGAPYPNQYPNGQGLADTLFRADPVNTTTLLFQNFPNSPNAKKHPYLQSQLLSKIFNNVTVRSNTFAVFLTVGFFECDDSTLPVTLGKELGRDQNRQVRHRMFAVIDRTRLQTIFSTSTVSTTSNQTIGAGQATVKLAAMSGTTAQGYKWSITPGTLVTVDTGANAETVVVTNVLSSTGAGPADSFVATFANAHTVPANTTLTITARGNPGPWQQMPFDPHNSSLIAHFSIID
jgi:hypothetical protein